MRSIKPVISGWKAALVSLGLVGFISSATAQLAAPPARSGGVLQARQIIAERKAVFTLLERNFKPVGEVLKGHAAYDPVEMRKRVERLEYLATFLDETFPASTNLGAPDTDASAEIWEDQEAFNTQLKAFGEHLKTLKDISLKETTASADFKRAALTVAQDCKACHDDFKQD